MSCEMLLASSITWKERDFTEKLKNVDTDLKIILLRTINIIT